MIETKLGTFVCFTATMAPKITNTYRKYFEMIVIKEVKKCENVESTEGESPENIEEETENTFMECRLKKKVIDINKKGLKTVTEVPCKWRTKVSLLKD